MTHRWLYTLVCYSDTIAIHSFGEQQTAIHDTQVKSENIGKILCGIIRVLGGRRLYYVRKADSDITIDLVQIIVIDNLNVNILLWVYS